MQRILLTGIIRVELPGYTVRLCDGGFLSFGGEIYQSVDPVFGSIAGFEQLTEGVGDELPAGKLTLVPDQDAAASLLSRGTYQNSRVALWIAELDEDTGALIGTPDLQIEAQIDRTSVRVAKTARFLDIEFTPRAERLFLINEGNTLSPQFHKSVWPGETGLDQATGLTIEQAWGAKSAPRGVSDTASAGFDRFGGGQVRNV